MTKRIAFITAIVGPYEFSTKKYTKQSIPCDFICFTNNLNIKNNGWIIDNTPYHLTRKSTVDTGKYTNSLSNNKHTFNIAKYFKQNFYNIPRLQQYDIIIWLDGTLQITNKDTALYILKLFGKKNIKLATWEHEERYGKLGEEVKASHRRPYTSTFWFGQKQPYQDVDRQYEDYLKQGYTDEYWKKINSREHFGVWVTCMIAFRNKDPHLRDFLDYWYLQTLKYTTQDQIGFPFACRKKNIIPYTFPDSNIAGKGHSQTDFYIKQQHHC